MYRSHKLNELRMEHVGQSVTISGWIDKVRDMGPFVFIDLRDRYGITQVLVNENSPKEVLELARR